MAAFNNFFRPLSSRSGVQVVVGSAAVGAGGLAAGASSTVSLHIAVPREKCKLLTLNIMNQVAAAGSGAITISAVRRNNAGAGANVALTAAKDITVATLTTVDKAFPFAITASDANTIFAVGDTLRLDVTAVGTVTTQPQVVVVAEFAVLS